MPKDTKDIGTQMFPRDRETCLRQRETAEYIDFMENKLWELSTVEDTVGLRMAALSEEARLRGKVSAALQRYPDTRTATAKHMFSNEAVKVRRALEEASTSDLVRVGATCLQTIWSWAQQPNFPNRDQLRMMQPRRDPSPAVSRRPSPAFSRRPRRQL